MFCSECHKRNPDNFVNCAYCGAKLTPPKKEKPQKYVKKKQRKINIPFKMVFLISMIVASLLVVAAVFTANFSGAKSEKVVKTFVKAIESENKEMYFSLYDSSLKAYKRDNRYFGEEETYKQIVLPVEKSNAFYKEKCGENYRLTYYIKSTTQLPEDELKEFNDVLESSFGYISLPNKVDCLNVEVVARGEKGNYKSIYSDFWCMKIKGHWYKVDKNIYTEYINGKTTA